MGWDKIGPYGMTSQERKMQDLFSVGRTENPYSKVEDPTTHAVWQNGFDAAWTVFDNEIADLCKGRS